MIRLLSYEEAILNIQETSQSLAQSVVKRYVNRTLSFRLPMPSLAALAQYMEDIGNANLSDVLRELVEEGMKAKGIVIPDEQEALRLLAGRTVQAQPEPDTEPEPEADTGEELEI